ncbi:MAG: ATPase domain-containing protein [Ignisphaera sp.]|uniref:KaiC domain-containing protein n=1 Tax=Ignisphaera aggregans TaxID=334771 RepID=A0A7C4JK72_9CREN
MSEQRFVFGVNGLDRMLMGVLDPPSMLVIAGHPGAGKTTLASSICYANALKGFKCLYISFQEDKEKLYKNMKNLNIDLERIEFQGNLKFARFPVALSVDDVVLEISNLILSYNPRLIIVDSMNVFLSGLVGNEVKRAWLQNYFYELSKQINGVVVLVSELPFGEERLQLGAIEFIADAILILKHRVERGLLIRSLEIRKIRGAPLHVAEVPFMIVEGVGLYVQPMEIPLMIPSEATELDVVCSELKKVIRSVRLGEIAYVSYPPDARIVEIGIAPVLLAFAIANNLKIMIISFKYSAETFRNIFVEQIINLGIEKDIATKIVDEYVEFIGINPFAVPPGYYPTPSLQRPVYIDVVVFHGPEARYISMKYRDYITRFFDVITRLKSERKLNITLAARISKKQYNSDTSFSDVVIKIGFTKNGKAYIKVWRKGGNIYKLTINEIETCYSEVAEKIKTKALEIRQKVVNQKQTNQ